MAFPMESLPRPVKTYHTEAYDRLTKQHGFEGKGKTILISGGAAGIGYGIVQAFANAGASRIAIISRSEHQHAKVKSDVESVYPSTQVLTFAASVTDNERMTSIMHGLGTLDVLVCNAAESHSLISATQITTEQMLATYATNTLAPFNMAKTFLAMPAPTSGGPKTIINVSSGAAYGRVLSLPAYSASKAAAVIIMQYFAHQSAKEDVRIFSYHPGVIWTPGTAKDIPKEALVWEDINLPAYFAVWLAGPESPFLHGRYLWAQWDIDDLIGMKKKFEEDPDFLTISLVK